MLLLLHPLVQLICLLLPLLFLGCVCFIHFLQDPEEETEVDADAKASRAAASQEADDGPGAEGEANYDTHDRLKNIARSVLPAVSLVVVRSLRLPPSLPIQREVYKYPSQNPISLPTTS